MSREIKFRAWDNARSKFVPPEDFAVNGAGELIMAMEQGLPLYPEPHFTGYNYEEDVTEHLTLMQFTGLLDKNGVEIYEGDILRYSIERDIQAIPMVVEIPNIFIELGHDDPYYTLDGDSFEVIGNIYENKELLK